VLFASQQEKNQSAANIHIQACTEKLTWEDPAIPKNKFEKKQQSLKSYFWKKTANSQMPTFVTPGNP